MIDDIACRVYEDNLISKQSCMCSFLFQESTVCPPFVEPFILDYYCPTLPPRTRWTGRLTCIAPRPVPTQSASILPSTAWLREHLCPSCRVLLFVYIMYRLLLHARVYYIMYVFRDFSLMTCWVRSVSDVRKTRMPLPERRKEYM